MFSILAEEPFLDTVPWSSIYFFWGDERCVLPSHEDSNYRMAYDALLSKVPVPPENIYRVPTELEDPEQMAEEYSARLTQFFLTGARKSQTAPLSTVPRFD